MEPDPVIFEKFRAVAWFSRCGNELSNALPFAVSRVFCAKAAIASARSQLWMDVGTHTQGDLTEYLAKTDYDVYGTTWNSLGDVIEKRIQNDVMPQVNDGLRRITADTLSKRVQLDLSRIALQSAYAKRFRRVPDFFQQLFAIFERGHLPCGWSDNLQAWPEGQFIVY
ncbi:MAG: hypothetical protein C0483_00815 [Pirellula sp.]|nr:hypothetical protein [Pirellula sp.]